jgi:hypothetical protein
LPYCWKNHPPARAARVGGAEALESRPAPRGDNDEIRVDFRGEVDDGAGHADVFDDNAVDLLL